MKLEQLLARKILLMDGAMGTALLARGAKGALEMLNVESASQVEALHEEYLQAGADIITTNTICADALFVAFTFTPVAFSNVSAKSFTTVCRLSAA